MEKEGVLSGRRLLQRGNASEVPKSEQVRCLLSELEELISSAELALAAGKHRRQSEHVCTAVCLRLHSLHQMLSPAAQVPTRGIRTDSESEDEGRNVNRGRRYKPLAKEPPKESGGMQSEPCSHWSEVMEEGQRSTAGSLVARLPHIVKRFAYAQQAKACDAADNLMQALGLPLVMQAHKPKKSERGTPPWVKPKLQSPEGLQELVTLARETKLCSYDEVVTQIRQQNKRSELQLCEEVELVDEMLDGNIDAHAEAWSVLLTCPLSLTRMQVPARSLACKHLECFDLLSHLKNNAATHLKVWRCPICKRSASWNELVVDSYVEQLLKEAPPDAVELVLHPDASWTVRSEENTFEKLGFVREFVDLADSDSGGGEDEAFYTPLQQSPPSENASERAEKVGHAKQEPSETDDAAQRGSEGLMGSFATQLTPTAATPNSASDRENAFEAAEDSDKEGAEDTLVQRAARGISLREVRALGSVKAADFTGASWLRPTEAKDYAEQKWRVEEPWTSGSVRKDGNLNRRKRKSEDLNRDRKSTKKTKQSLEGQKLVSAVLGQQKKSGYVRIGGWGGARIGAKFWANKRLKEPVTGRCANNVAEEGAGTRKRGRLPVQRVETKSTTKRRRDEAASQERSLKRKTVQKSLHEVGREPSKKESKTEVREHLTRSKGTNAEQAVRESRDGFKDNSSKPGCGGPSKKSENGADVAKIAGVSSKAGLSESKPANAPEEADRLSSPEHAPDKQRTSEKRLRTPSVRLEEPRSAAEHAGFGGFGIGRLLGFGAKLGFGAVGLPHASSQKTASVMLGQQVTTAAERKEDDQKADKQRKERIGARLREPSRKAAEAAAVLEQVTVPSKEVPIDGKCSLDERKNAHKQDKPDKGLGFGPVGLGNGLTEQSTEAVVQSSSSKKAADINGGKESGQKSSAKAPIADKNFGAKAEIGSEAIGLSSKAPSASSAARAKGASSSGQPNAPQPVRKAAGPVCKGIEGDTCSEKKASSRMENPCSGSGASPQKEKKSEGSKGTASKKDGKKQPKNREVGIDQKKAGSTIVDSEDLPIKRTMVESAAKAKKEVREKGLIVKKSVVPKPTGPTKSGAEEKAVMKEENKRTSSTRLPVCDIDLNLPEASNVEMYRSDAEQGDKSRGSGGDNGIVERSVEAWDQSKLLDAWTTRFQWLTEADPYTESQAHTGTKQELRSRVADRITERHFQQFTHSASKPRLESNCANSREGPSGQADPGTHRESSQGGQSARLEATEEKFRSRNSAIRTRKVVLGDLNRLPSNIIDLTVETSDGNEQEYEMQRLDQKEDEGSRKPARIKGGGKSVSPEIRDSSGPETPEQDGVGDLQGQHTFSLKREDLKGGWSEQHFLEEERFLIPLKERAGEKCTEATQESELELENEKAKKEKEPQKGKRERKIDPEEEENAAQHFVMPSSDLLARALASRVSECLTTHEGPESVMRPDGSSWRAEACKRRRKRARAKRAETVNALGVLEPPKLAEVFGVNGPQHNGEPADVDKVLRAADQYLQRVGRAPSKDAPRLVAPAGADESLANLLHTQMAIDYLVSAMQGDARAQQADVLLRRLNVELQHSSAFHRSPEHFSSQAESGGAAHATNFGCSSLRTVDKSMLEEWVKIFEGRIG